MVVDDNGVICDTDVVLGVLADDIRAITDLAQWQLYADAQLLADLDTDTGLGQNNVVARRLGISLPKAIQHKGRSRFERMFRDRVVSEAKSWNERVKATENRSAKRVSAGWKRTMNGAAPADLAPKIRLSAVDQQYATLVVSNGETGSAHGHRRAALSPAIQV